MCRDLSYVTYLKDFFENNVGRIISMYVDKYDKKVFYDVKFENIPIEIIDYIKKYYVTNFDNNLPYTKNYIRLDTPEEIKEQELKNSAHKFNL